MKVITQKRLREIKESMPDGQSKLFVHALITQCQELDTLTVTRLRPMSEAPDHEYSLFVHKEGRRPTEGYKNDLSIVIDGEPIPSACFAGWIPMPRYEPENV